MAGFSSSFAVRLKSPVRGVATKRNPSVGFQMSWPEAVIVSTPPARVVEPGVAVPMSMLRKAGTPG